MQHRLVWFRDDLRIRDNAALSAALEGAYGSVQVSAVFLTADREWAEFGYGANRLYFTEQALRSLAQPLANLGVRFTVARCDDYADQSRWIHEYCEQNQVDALYFNHEYQINERRRDHALKSVLEPKVKVSEFHDRIVLPPGSVLTGDGRYYSVFSPFKRRWLSVYAESASGPYPTPSPVGSPQPEAEWSPLCESAESSVDGLALSESDAWLVLEAFVQRRLTQYESTRNSPAIPGTSRLSPYLARGLLSPRQCIQAAELAIGRSIQDFSSDAFSWINELIWREFYHHLLVGFPRLSKSKAFKPETEAVLWRNDPDEIHAWQSGMTGIPIVDAGMRELAATGWMHNRVRMIVAQFLTKNLLVDWRVGEAHFMRYLWDSDLAANNGGWQWSASTGTDAAPYFRVFNPVSQGETHDPEAVYITKWIPELASLPVKKRHTPWLSGGVSGYPSPLVDLKSTRARAIAAFKELSK